MFYSDTILSRRGPLGRVWLAAHMERKLSKTQTLQTDIEQSVDAIMDHEVEVMALRLSGQLLLGVVRIYSRKAKYLLDDCNEALLKIKMAFRPGLVDVNDDELVVSKNSITLAPNMVDLDLLLPDVHWDLDFEHPAQPHVGHHQAHVDDITLRTMDDFQQLEANPFDVGPSDGIGSQDFYDLDLGIDWDGRSAPKDDLSSVGVGRDASRRASSELRIGDLAETGAISILSERSPSRASVARSAGAQEFQLPTFESVDLGEFGVGFDAQDIQVDNRAVSRASSPLTELAATPKSIAIEIKQKEGELPERKKVKEKKQIVDSVTELVDEEGRFVRLGTTQDARDIVVDYQFLRNSSVTLRLLEIHANPLTHFFRGKGKLPDFHNCDAPYGIAPELKQLFTRPSRVSSGKRNLASPGHSSPKRRRIDEQPPQVEVGRIGVSPPASLRLGSELLEPGPDLGGRGNEDMDAQMEIADLQPDVPVFRSKSNSPFPESQVLLPSIGQRDTADYSLDNEPFPLSALDVCLLRPSQSQISDPDADAVPDRKGFSKNTVRASEVIRNEFGPSHPAREAEVLSFRKISNKASRRAAASFFFELLVLGTRDCLKLSQPMAFEDIQFTAKERFWTFLPQGQVVETA